MKRYRIVNRKRFMTFITIVVLACVILIGSAMGLFNASSKDVARYTTVHVQEGDTLWQLARQYGNQNMDVREVIYEICKLNDVTAGTLRAGQVITIPN